MSACIDVGAMAVVLKFISKHHDVPNKRDDMLYLVAQTFML